MILVGLCSLVISPWSRAELGAYKERFAQRDDVTRLSSGQFIEAKSGKQIFFLEAVDQDNKTVERVFMAEPSQSGAQTVVSSKKGRIEEHPNGDRYVVLNDGKRYEVPRRFAGGRQDLQNRPGQPAERADRQVSGRMN